LPPLEFPPRFERAEARGVDRPCGRRAREALGTRGPCYLRRRNSSPPVGTKRSASRESSHIERNALAASPRWGRLQRSLCLAGTSAALLGLGVVSCHCSSIDRRYGRNPESAVGRPGGSSERATKRLQRSCVAAPWLHALPVGRGPREQHAVCAPLVGALGDPSLPVAPRLCLPQSNGVVLEGELALPYPPAGPPGACHEDKGRWHCGDESGPGGGRSTKGRSDARSGLAAVTDLPLGARPRDCASRAARSVSLDLAGRTPLDLRLSGGRASQDAERLNEPREVVSHAVNQGLHRLVRDLPVSDDSYTLRRGSQGLACRVRSARGL
jgi:hypothetical protein